MNTGKRMRSSVCNTYNKYGEWVNGTWMPYDDMEEA